MLIVWLSDLTFWRDEWGFLLHRRGLDPDVFLRPHYEHIAISLIAVYKGLQATFGMDSPKPFQAVATLTFLSSVALMFAYVRRRASAWVALAAALPILVLGTAWDDLLWPFQTGFFASMSCGLGALLLAERRDRTGDVAACALLTISISFSSLGLPFAVGAAVDVAWGADRRRRAFVAAVPLAFYALWWAGWGHEADTAVSLHNLVTLPSYVLDGFASSTASLVGLGPPSQVVASPLDWGRAAFAGAAALAVWRVSSIGRLWRSLAVVLAISVSFWALAGLNASIFREPTSGRYQYMGAIFIVLIAAELLAGLRIRRWAAVAVVGVALLAALSNVAELHARWAGLTQFGRMQRADLAALEIDRDHIDPGFELTEQNSGVDYLGFLNAGSYFSAVDDFGSPAYTPAELAAAAEDARGAADKVFAAALGVGLQRGHPAAVAGSCTATKLSAARSAATLAAPGVVLRAETGGAVAVRLRRYASETFPVRLGSVAAGRSATLRIVADGSSEPWELGLSGRGRVAVCELEAS